MHFEIPESFLAERLDSGPRLCRSPDRRVATAGHSSELAVPSQMAKQILEAKRKSFVSRRALAEILALVPDPDNEAGTSRPALKRRIQSEVRLKTPCGPLWKQLTLTAVDEGDPLTVHYLEPAPMLWAACQHGEGFRSFLLQRFDAQGCTAAAPWNIVLYADEVSPGNQLKASNERKLQVVYWSLKELGGHALSKEDSWFVLTAVRSCDVVRLCDGMSQLMRHMMHAIIAPALRHGVALPLEQGGRPRMLCAKFGSCSHAIILI